MRYHAQAHLSAAHISRRDPSCIQQSAASHRRRLPFSAPSQSSSSLHPTRPLPGHRVVVLRSARATPPLSAIWGSAAARWIICTRGTCVISTDIVTHTSCYLPPQWLRAERPPSRATNGPPIPAIACTRCQVRAQYSQSFISVFSAFRGGGQTGHFGGLALNAPDPPVKLFNFCKGTVLLSQQPAHDHDEPKPSFRNRRNSLLDLGIPKVPP